MEKKFSSIRDNQSCGRSGTGSIDLFSGNLTFVHDLIHLDGLHLPMNISFVYSSYNKSFCNDYKLPGNWLFSFMQTLTQKDSDSEDPKYESYILEDSTGRAQTITTRYYKNITEGSGDTLKTYKKYGFKHTTSGISSEISNDQYFLTKSGNIKYLTDNAGNRLTFNANGLITSIETAEAVLGGGSKMTFAYGTNQITITDGIERTAVIYFTSGILNRIVCGNTAVYFDIDSAYKLEGIRHCSTTSYNTLFSTMFAYLSLSNGVHKLTNVIDSSGLELEYIYSDYRYCYEQAPVLEYRVKSNTTKIQYCKDSCNGAVKGQQNMLDKFTITYDADDKINLTKFTNKFGVNMYYYFRSDGGLSMSYDDKGNTKVNSTNTNFYIGKTEEDGVDYSARSIDANVLGTAPNLITRSFPTSISEQNGEYKWVSYSIAGNELESIDTGWYVFTVEVKGDLAAGDFFSSIIDANAKGIPYLALGRSLSYSETSIQAEMFTKADENIDGWQVLSLPFYVYKKNLIELSVGVEINKNYNEIALRNWTLKKACSFADTSVYGNRRVSSSDGKTNGNTYVDTDLTKRNNNTRVTTIKAPDVDSFSSVATYNATYKERIMSEDDGLGLKKTYAYDGYGNVTSETVEDKESGQKMLREYTYATFDDSKLNGNFVKTMVDEAGNTLTSDYNVTGSLKKTILPGSGQNIDYAYTGIEELLSELKAVGNNSNHVNETSNKLYYNEGYVTRMEHNGFTYDFDYDGFGRISKVYVGGKLLIASSYSDSGSNIDEVNGAVSKIVTSYENDIFSSGLFCGQNFCGQLNILNGFVTDNSKSVRCGQAICGQTVTGAGIKGNSVYASYYNKYGDLIKVRYATNVNLDYEFAPSSDYVTITETTAGDRKVVTYYIGTKKYEYHYSLVTGELTEQNEYSGSAQVLKIEPIDKDRYGRINGVKYTTDSIDVQTYGYDYKSPYVDIVKTVTLPTGKPSTIEIDNFGRLKSRILNTASAISEEYLYKAKDSTYTTSLVEIMKLKNSGIIQTVYKYQYDANNNITHIRNSSDTVIASYEYDGLNRLIRENITGDKITVYKYDNGGNIQFKKVYDYGTYIGFATSILLDGSGGTTVSYKYEGIGNKDRLLSYNGSGDIEYDDQGNPNKWFIHGNNGSSLGYNLIWTHGKDLSRISGNGLSVKFEYNDEGIRTRKTVNGAVCDYYVDGNRIIAEKRINGTTINKLNYYYDQTGICGFSYNGTEYYYQKNLQGDIVKVYNNGNLVAEYSYDAWGKCSIINNVGGIADVNPWRYRSYYCDSEIELYYLNGRYFDSNVARFLNADKVDYFNPESINGLNLYAYCLNNPIKFIDIVGNEPKINVGIDIWSLFKLSGYVWKGVAVPIYSKSSTPFDKQIDYHVFEASALNGKLSILSLTDKSFTTIDIGGNIFNGKVYLNSIDNIGATIGSVNLEFLNVSWNADNPGFTLVDAQATALTIGAYTQYFDAELLVGSIGATAKWENGALTLGFSFGWGIKITIRFW